MNINTFIDEINTLENVTSEDNFIFKNRNSKVLLSAPHSIFQHKENGNMKLNEPFTKAICLYVSNICNTNYIVKTNDNYIDPNHSENDEYKDKMLSMIEENDIKLVIDIHGAKEDRDFDVELGTLNNLSADYSTIMELVDSFKNNYIYNIKFNDPFKGGEITKKIYEYTNIDVIQIEINAKYRSLDNPTNLYNLCKSLIDFINIYNSK